MGYMKEGAPLEHEPAEPDESSPDEHAEAEEDGSDNHVAPPEAPDEPEASAVVGEHEVDDRYRKLERSAATWRRRVSDVLGEDALALVPCELCVPEIPGFHFPAEVEQPRDDVHARLLAVLDAPPEPEYRDDDQHTRCKRCDGFGKLRSGSRVPNQDTLTCSTCAGFGYTPPPGATTTPDAEPTNGATAPPQTGGEEAAADADLWGSPRHLPDGQENPNFGRMPQYKIAGLP